MKRSSLRKPSQVRENAAESSWRDHPVVVASISVAATLTLMGGVVFPLLTAHLSSEIAGLRKVVDAKSEEIGGLKKQIEGLDHKLSEEKAAIQKMEDENTKISEKFRLAIIENPFVLPSGYPKGLDTIRVGSTPAEVDVAFLDVPIDKKNGDYWSVDVNHPIFSSVTYYFGENSREITHILFQNKFQGPIRDDDFLPLLNRYFGRPRISIDDSHLWATGGVNKERISMEGSGSFLILGQDFLPNWVTRSLAKCTRNGIAHEGDLKAFCEQFAKPRKQPNKEH